MTLDCKNSCGIKDNQERTLPEYSCLKRRECLSTNIANSQVSDAFPHVSTAFSSSCRLRRSLGWPNPVVFTPRLKGAS